MKRLIFLLSLSIPLTVALCNCTSSSSPLSDSTVLPADSLPSRTNILSKKSFELTSTAFQANAFIPDRYGCHGANLSPALAWNEPPVGTTSLVLIMDDPDAVKVVGYVWVHWLLFNIPVSTKSLSEGIPAKAELPDGSRHGQNNFFEFGYGGPCPPNSQTHNYHFTLYAVDIVLNLKSGSTKDNILKAIDGHILARAELIGRYATP